MSRKVLLWSGDFMMWMSIVFFKDSIDLMLGKDEIDSACLVRF